MKKILKNSLSLVLALTVIFSSAIVGLGEADFSGLFTVEAQAANSGTCGKNLTWTLDDKGVLTISGTGAMADYNEYAGTPWSGAKSVIIKNGVTSIGNCAFYGSNITSVTIPSSVKTIGEYAFYACKKLTTVKFSKGLESIGFWAFVKCTNLKSIVLPEGLKNIAHSAFEGCSNLKSIAIPDSVITLYSTSFRNTAYYNDANNWVNGILYLDDCLLTADEGLTGNCKIKEGTRVIAGDAFYWCGESVTSITIPDSMEVIGEWAFRYCSAIESITIPDSVTNLLRGAFSGCENLKSIVLSNNLKTIEMQLFDGCQSLASIEIPDSVTSIDSYIFSDCVNLKSITIPDSVTRIGDWSYDFRDTPYYKNADNWENETLYIGNHIIKTKDTIIGGYDVKPGTITIADNAFVNCEKLVTVTIPGSVKTIGASAFENCKNLVSVNISEGVTTICDEAFLQCAFLESVTVPESVTDIGKHALGYNSTKAKNTDFVICGKPGTAAETYAKENGFKFVDANHIHSASDWKSVQKSTVLLNGINVKECSICRTALEVQILPMLTPAAPEVKVENSNTGGVFVSWNKVEGADEYIVYRRVYDPETEKWSGWTRIKDGITVGGYTDRNVEAATYYRYTVKARNAGGYGPYTSGAKTYYISTPKLASIEHDFKNVTFKWNKVDEATGYIVYRRNVDNIRGKWERIGTTKDTVFVDETANTGVNYKYTVRAYYGSYRSDFDESGLQVIMLLTPELTGIDCERTGVRICWRAPGAEYCYVYRREYNADTKKWSGWTRIASKAYSTYLDETAKSGTYYIYTVKAISNKYGNYTVSGYDKTGLKICFLATPEIKSATSTKTGIKLQWNRIDGANGYKVYRRVGSAPWGTAIATVKGNEVVSYVDKTAQKGVTYTYTIRAYRGTTRSEYIRPGTTVKDIY